MLATVKYKEMVEGIVLAFKVAYSLISNKGKSISSQIFLCELKKNNNILLWQISNILRNEENNGLPSIHYKASEIFNILLNFFQDSIIEDVYMLHVFT